MEHLDKILAIILTTLTVGLIRHWISNLDKKVDFFIEAHHACQRKLPEKYADKKNVTKAFERLDKQGERISRLEGIRNGARA